MLKLVLDDILMQFERVIMDRKFTLLGAIQLDKEIKMLMDYFTRHTSRIRNKFSRINQMVSLLNQEKVLEPHYSFQAIDVLELWSGNSSTIRWKLSADQVRQLVSQRTDFSKVQVDQLKDGIK